MSVEAWQWEQLERAILALAQPAEVQLSLFPDFVCKADELALDFEDAYLLLVGHEAEISDGQRSALEVSDARLLIMSGPTAFWTEEALRTHPVWAEVRTLAKAVLVAFGWGFRVPTPSGAFYVPAGREKRLARDWFVVVRGYVEKLFRKK